MDPCEQADGGTAPERLTCDAAQPVGTCKYVLIPFSAAKVYCARSRLAHGAASGLKRAQDNIT